MNRKKKDGGEQREIDVAITAMLNSDLMLDRAIGAVGEYVQWHIDHRAISRLERDMISRGTRQFHDLLDFVKNPDSPRFTKNGPTAKRLRFLERHHREKHAALADKIGASPLPLRQIQ